MIAAGDRSGGHPGAHSANRTTTSSPGHDRSTARLATASLRHMTVSMAPIIRIVATPLLLVGLIAVWMPRAVERPSAQSAPSSSVTVIVTLAADPAEPRRSADLHSTARGLSPAEADHSRALRDRRRLDALEGLHGPRRREVVEQVRQLGGTLLYALRARNILIVRLPESRVGDLEKVPGVASVERDTVRRAQLDVATTSMLVSSFWNAGHTGGAVDVAVIDSGLSGAHPAFAPGASHIYDGIFHAAAQLQPNYCDSTTDPADYVGHGTGVGGMVFSQGTATYPNHKGTAFGLDRSYNLKAAYRTCPGGGLSLESDAMAAFDTALGWTDPPEVFNYSYGGETSADDDGISRFIDSVVDQFDKVVTISGGNEGPISHSITSPAIAYNVLAVANVNDRRTTDRGDDAIFSGSSVGPTWGGRKKPDIAAPATQIVAPSMAGGWSTVTGTSFAAPALAGAAALLIDAGVSDARAVKAILINAADDRGTAGWDASWGWGYYNGSTTYAWRNNVSVVSVARPGAVGEVQLFGQSASETTKATAVWNRDVTYGGPSYPSGGILQDVNIRAFGETTNTLRAESISAIDNVEQVTSTVAEPTVLVLESYGTYTYDAELVALAHSGGFVQRTGPQVSVQLPPPVTVTAGTTSVVSATVTNTGDLHGHAYSATLTLPSGFALVSGSNPQSLGTLAPGAAAIASWTLRAPAGAQPATSLAAHVTTTSVRVGVVRKRSILNRDAAGPTSNDHVCSSLFGARRGRHGADDHRNWLRHRGDGDHWRRGGHRDKCPRQHVDHGDDAGARRRGRQCRGDQSEWTEWISGRRLYVRRAVDGDLQAVLRGRGSQLVLRLLLRAGESECDGDGECEIAVPARGRRELRPLARGAAAQSANRGRQGGAGPHAGGRVLNGGRVRHGDHRGPDDDVGPGDRVWQPRGDESAGPGNDVVPGGGGDAFGFPALLPDTEPERGASGRADHVPPDAAVGADHDQPSRGGGDGAASRSWSTTSTRAWRRRKSRGS